MTRQYEAVYIFDATLEDAAINEKLDRFHKLLGSPSDLESNHWGRRQLAYPIGRTEAGYYVVSRFTADAATLPEYERALKLDDGVVRYLITLYEHELGAPPMSEEELAAAAARRGAEDEEEDED
jgi:small subunit ribosomal protein S6